MIQSPLSQKWLIFCIQYLRSCLKQVNKLTQTILILFWSTYTLLFLISYNSSSSICHEHVKGWMCPIPLLHICFISHLIGICSFFFCTYMTDTHSIRAIDVSSHILLATCSTNSIDKSVEMFIASNRSIRYESKRGACLLVLLIWKNKIFSVPIKRLDLSLHSMRW